MANVGTAAAGKTLIGAGNGASPTFADIGTNSGLTNHGVILGQGNAAFAVTTAGNAGQVLVSNGAGSDPTFQTISAAGAVTQLNTDSGGLVSPVAGVIPVLGYQAGTVPTMETYKEGNNLRIANQTWETQYVVDPSSTAGLKGTFQTIQAAINAALADGMGVSNPKKIYIRFNSAPYTENLTIYAGTTLVGELIPRTSDPVALPSIIGNHTFDNVCILNAKGINFINSDPTANTFTVGAVAIIIAQDCEFKISGGTGLISQLPTSTSTFYNCTFENGAGFQDIFQMTNGSVTEFYSCNFGVGGLNFSGTSTANIYNGINVGLVSGDLGLNAYSTSFTGSGADNIAGTGSGGILFDCSFTNNTATATAVSNTGLWLIRNISKRGQDGPSNLYLASTDATARTSLASAVAGNVYRSTRVSADYTVTDNDYYIGVTSTAAARTITLPVSSNGACLDRVYIIKDESGGAATHNITVTASGGVLLDNATTAVINQNYGSLSVIWSGSQYFIM